MYQAAQRTGMGFDWNIFSNIFQSAAGAASQILPGVIGGNVSTLPVYTGNQQYPYQTGYPQADTGSIFDEMGPLLLLAGGAVVLFLVVNSSKKK